MFAFVYMWVDITTGKRYIGSHKGDPMDGYICSSKPMLRDYKKYPQNFQRAIIDSGSWKDMLVREQALIVEHNAVKDPMFYNQAHSFGPYHCDTTGIKRAPFTKEHKAKISAAQMGRKRGPMMEEQKAKLSAALKGRKHNAPHTEEHKNKLRVAQTGRKLTEETKARMSAAKKGNKYSLGYVHTEETKARMSAAKKARRKPNV